MASRLYPEVLHWGAAVSTGQGPGGTPRPLHSHGHISRDDFTLKSRHLRESLEDVHCYGQLFWVKLRLKTDCLLYDGKHFSSDEIWVIISVEVAGTLAITQQMSNLNQLGKIPASQYNEQSRKVSYCQEPDQGKTTSIIHSEQDR